MAYIKRHSLGRDGHLGDLYNAFSDQFSGENLFRNPLPTSFMRRDNVTDGPKMAVPKFDTLEQNFEMLQVDRNSQLNVLCLHNRSLPGSGQYLMDSEVSYQWGDNVRQSIIYTVPTKTQKFNPFDRDVITHFNVDTIKRTQATHVVTKIEWGANAILTLKEEVRVDNGREFLEKDLYHKALKIKHKFSKCKNITRHQNQMNFSLAADIEPRRLLIRSVREALIFMRKIPDILKKFYNNFGKPLVFILVPINDIMKILNLYDPQQSLIYREINDEKIMVWVKSFSDYNVILKKLFDLEVIIRSKNQNLYFCDYPRLLRDVSTLLHNGIAYKADAKKMLRRAVLVARTDGNLDAINKIIIDFFNYKNKMVETYDKIRNILPAMDGCVDILKPGIDGINPNTDYHFYTGHMSFESKNNWRVWKAFVLFTRSDFKYTERNFWAHLHFFMSLKEMNASAEMWIVDLDEYPGFHFEQTRIVEMVFRDRKLFVLSEDYFKDTANNGLNLMHAVRYDLVTEQPIRRAALKMSCPRTFAHGGCDIKDDYWHCSRCREEVEYGYDGHFYCHCGRALYTNCRFRCKNEEHGGYTGTRSNVFLVMFYDICYHPGLEEEKYGVSERYYM